MFFCPDLRCVHRHDPDHCHCPGPDLDRFILAVFEITIWITVASAVINQVKEYQILTIFYALGYATGNVAGINVEKKLAFGFIILRSEDQWNAWII